MNHPPYHLRPNKAVDRFLLIELLKRLSNIVDIREYTYYTLGGPFLEDCRLIDQYFPELEIVSFETDSNTFLRQQFHKFRKNLTLRNQSIAEFLQTFTSTGTEVFWLDFTSLRFEFLTQFSELLNASENGTVVKITLKADFPTNPTRFRSVLCAEAFRDRIEEFQTELSKQFGAYLPKELKNSSFRASELPAVVQMMIQLAAEEALPAQSGRTFQPLSLATYSDGTQMVSVSGIVTTLEEKQSFIDVFRKWKFANLEWESPRKIQIPVLSTKERLHLERILPIKKTSGRALLRRLGYVIEKDEEETLRRLEQYADFHSYYPNYGKIIS